MTLTAEQFNKLATKDDLDEIRKEMTNKDDLNKVLSAVDGLSQEI